MDIFDEQRADELETLLPRYRASYEAGTPEVPDEVYDALRDELRALRPDSGELKAVGAPVVTEWFKVTHGLPMGSLDKVNLPVELEKWASDRKAPEHGLFWTEKLDGLSVHLRYELGSLMQALTRGDGITGEDIFRNVVKMKGVVQEIPGFTGSIRGEIILLKSDLKQHFPDYANTRNTAAGVSKRYDGKGSEHLSVIVYEVLEGDIPDDNYQLKQMLWLRNKGFIVPNSGSSCSVSNVNAIWQDYQDRLRDALDYDIDGLVIRLDDMAAQHALGEKDGCPLGAVAFKFAPITRESTIRKIEWQVGASGRITPVAIFDPVNVLGATITNASVYNLAEIRKLKISIGAKVLIARANDVIPKVMSVITPNGEPAEGPSNCPVCSAETEMEGEYLICPNTASCPAQAVGRIERYIKSLDIKEWGEVLVEKLVTSGKVKSVPDLYRLTVKDLAELDRISEGVAEKLLKILRDKNPIPLENLLGSLSIPGCASSTIRMVMDAGHDTWEKMKAVDIAMLLRVPGLGPVKSRALAEWLGEQAPMVDELQELGVAVKEIIIGSLTGKSFCFTGTMTRKRGDLEAMVLGAGGTVKDRVGKGLSYLVMADPNSGSSKAVAARKNGTACISEEEFLSMAVG